MGLSQGTYLKFLGIFFLIIAFGSSFSLGYNWRQLNPGDWAVKISFIMIYFMGFWFFLNKGKEIQNEEKSLPTITEATKIIEEFQTNLKTKKRIKPAIHKSVHK